MEQLPKVLILSHGFRAGDAITTLNLFSQFPKENLYCASLSYEKEFIDRLNQCYQIGNREIRYPSLFKYIGKAKESGIIYSCDEEKDSVSMDKCKIRGKVYRKILMPAMQWIGLYHKRYSLHLSYEMNEWIESIKPRFIYTSIGDPMMAKLVLEITNKFPQIKLAIHGFDDWLTPSYSILFEKKYWKNSDRLLRNILNRSSHFFTSSEKMAIEYKARYGMDFHFYPTPVNTERYKCSREKMLMPNIIFVGKIAWHNANAIQDLCKAINYMKGNGKILFFDIYSTSTEAQIRNFLGDIPSFVRLHSSVPHTEVPQLLAQSHIVYLPISITIQASKFTRYSMSTKMGEYLSCGVPMLYYGPENIAMTDFLKTKKCCCVVSTKSIGRLVEAIEYCLSDAYSSSLLMLGSKVADEIFNIDSISKRFLREFV